MNIHWKWTKGEPYERSRRIQNNDKNQEKEIEPEQKFSKEIEQDAYTSSLNYDENTWDILNHSLSGVGFKSSNKREELDFKIADRELVQQRGFNPFMDENNYVNDVTIRDQFLKPMNTTQDRVKNGNNEDI
jgi:hypothetical protein